MRVFVLILVTTLLPLFTAAQNAQAPVPSAKITNAPVSAAEGLAEDSFESRLCNNNATELVFRGIVGVLRQNLIRTK